MGAYPPDIVKLILNGTQPPSIYLQRLIREEISPIWKINVNCIRLGNNIF